MHGLTCVEPHEEDANPEEHVGDGRQGEWIRCSNESSGETGGSVRPGSDRMGSLHA